MKFLLLFGILSGETPVEVEFKYDAYYMHYVKELVKQGKIFDAVTLAKGVVNSYPTPENLQVVNKLIARFGFDPLALQSGKALIPPVYSQNRTLRDLARNSDVIVYRSQGNINLLVVRSDGRIVKVTSEKPVNIPLRGGGNLSITRRFFKSDDTNVRVATNITDITVRLPKGLIALIKSIGVSPPRMEVWCTSDKTRKLKIAQRGSIQETTLQPNQVLKIVVTKQSGAPRPTVSQSLLNIAVRNPFTLLVIAVDKVLFNDAPSFQTIYKIGVAEIIKKVPSASEIQPASE